MTATALADADPQHSGMASGVNNAVSRTAQLMSVAVLPLVAGLSGADYESPTAMADGFHAAMLATAVVAVAGSVLAFATIRSDVLERAGDPERAPCQEALDRVPERHCAVAGTPLESASRSVRPASDGGRPDGRASAQPTAARG